MPKVTFIVENNQEVTLDVPDGYSVMEAAVQNKIEAIEGACGGSLACATCHVYVHPDWWDKCLPDEDEISMEEEDMLDLAFDVRPKSRLSCQIVMSEALDGLIVALPGTSPDW